MRGPLGLGILSSPCPAAGPSLRPPGLGGSVVLYTQGEGWADPKGWQEIIKRDRGREREGSGSPRQAGVHTAGHRPPHSPKARLRSPQLCDCLVSSLPLERPSQAWSPQPGTPDLTKKPGLTKDSTPMSQGIRQSTKLGDTCGGTIQEGLLEEVGSVGPSQTRAGFRWGWQERGQPRAGTA